MLDEIQDDFSQFFVRVEIKNEKVNSRFVYGKSFFKPKKIKKRWKTTRTCLMIEATWDERM